MIANTLIAHKIPITSKKNLTYGYLIPLVNMRLTSTKFKVTNYISYANDFLITITYNVSHYTKS